MDRIDQLIDLMGQLVEVNKEILREIQNPSANPAAEEILWIDSLQTEKFLNMSRSTRIRRTVDETFLSKKFGSRTYYSAKQVLELRNQFLK